MPGMPGNSQPSGWQQHNGSIPEQAKHLGALSDKLALKAEKVSADPAAEHGAGK
jgi:hypothetical protein